MVKISANIEESDAAAVKRLAANRREKQSDIIRLAIHEYCQRANRNKSDRSKILSETKGVFKDNPLDAHALRKESNAGARI